MEGLFINIIQRTHHARNKFDTLFRMWESARQRGLPSTTLVTLNTLRSPEDCERIRAFVEGSADELGLAFHDFQSPEFQRTHATRETAAWLLPQKTRSALYDEMTALFEERFGHSPAAAGDYVMDAWSLRHLEKRHPSVKVAVTSCFEEGVNMFRGNNHNWHLMSDGGPWMPFFPSRANALVPAASPGDAIDIVAVPHLARDMVMAIASRDDLFASHPLNLFRARINDGADCPYHYRALDQWARQAALNGWEYYNIFVSSGWLAESNWAVPDLKNGWSIYEATLDAFRHLQDDGRATVSTMSGFSDAFRAQRDIHGEPHICHWKDVLHAGAKREVVWVSNSHYRSALDLNIGGTIVDLRPYAGRLLRDLGPECPDLQNGSYPFLISSEHRGGFWNSGQAAFLEIKGKSLPLWESNRVAARVSKTADGWCIEAEPVVADGPDGPLRVVTRWHFGRGPGIRIEREILMDDTAQREDLGITEWFGGCFGTTEYPENLKGIVLRANGANGKDLGKLEFAYLSREIRIAAPRSLSAEIPQARATVEMIAHGNTREGVLSDGWLFSPYFGLRLTQPATPGKPVSTTITIKPLP